MIEKSRHESFRITPELTQRLQDLRELWGMNESETIRHCILSAHRQEFGTVGKPKKTAMQSEVFLARGETSAK